MSIPIENSQVTKTTADWTAQNPILGRNVIGIEVISDNINRFKQGNGVTRWNSLPYLDKKYLMRVSELENDANYISSPSGNIQNGYFLKGNGTNTVTQCSPATVRSDIGAAASSHNHSTDNITSGTFGVPRGGTGNKSFVAGRYLVGNGTNAITTKSSADVRADIQAAGAEIGWIYLPGNSAEQTTNITFPSKFLQLPSAILIDTEINTSTAAATNKTALLLNSGTLSRIVTTSTGYVRAYLLNGTLHIIWKLTGNTYVKWLAIYE